MNVEVALPVIGVIKASMQLFAQLDEQNKFSGSGFPG